MGRLTRLRKAKKHRKQKRINKNIKKAILANLRKKNHDTNNNGTSA